MEMPIRAENRSRYPKNWPAISRAIRERAGNRCEECGAENGQPHPTTGSRVVLTCAHLDHQPENCASANLRAWCQKCHNAYDAPMRAAGIRERRRATMADGDLFPPSQPASADL
jgi:5-methylcytosine-specific restriction endonuclease McrA